MTEETRDRKWLRSFLHLGREARREKISDKEIERQEDTVLRALEILDSRPGVLLADEVGMGKTFEAAAIMACFLKKSGKNRILVITPGPDLNKHWMAVMDRFREGGFYKFRKDEYQSISHLTQLPGVANNKKCKVVFAPINIFLNVKGEDEQVFLLNAFFRWAKLDRKRRQEICKAYFQTQTKVKDVSKMNSYMGAWSYKELVPILDEAFVRGKGSSDYAPVEFEGLSDILKRLGTKGFKDKRLVRKALSRARFKILNKKLPEFSLLVVDEAHKLKNPWTVRAQAFDTILFNKYRKTVFLTATPFQLGVHELHQVFRLFSFARLNAGERKALWNEVDELFVGIEEYQRLYDEFEELWRYIDESKTEEFEKWTSLYPLLDGPCFESRELEALAETLRRLHALKEEIEPGFRSWMIRSLKADKLTYRQEHSIRVPERNASLPFLLHERLLFELYRSNERVFKAAVEINMTSSFDAAKSGEMLRLSGKKKHPELHEYRVLLKRILEMKRVLDHHPKVEYVVEDVLDSLKKGEKTLIFCERVQTAMTLKRRCDDVWGKHIRELWRKALPAELSNAEIRRNQRNYQKYCTTATSPYYLLLSDNYVPLLLDRSDFVKKNKKQIVNRANWYLARLRLKGVSVRNVDFKMVKRCLEHATFHLLSEMRPGEIAGMSGNSRQLVDRILDRDFILTGIKPDEGDKEEITRGGDGKKPEWRISAQLAGQILNPTQEGIWSGMREGLAKLPPGSRVEFVDAVKSYLTKQQVEFLPLLIRRARGSGDEINIRKVKSALDAWWASGKCPWKGKTEALLEYCIGLNESQRKTVLEIGLQSPSPVRHTLDASGRLGLKEGFNTPFYPIVLICNTPMQEGLDLHRECTRLIHHDLCWNPAKIEQRVGRLDRIGSKVNRDRAVNSDAKLDLYYPLISRTIDVHQYEVVKQRQKWLEFLLGRPPEFLHEPFGEVEFRPLPSAIQYLLAIDLGPKQLPQA